MKKLNLEKALTITKLLPLRWKPPCRGEGAYH